MKKNVITFDRKELFDFFSTISNPFYMVSFVVDVTNLKEYTKKNNCSFYYSLIYLCNKALESIDNFLYICEDNQIYLLDKRIPSFTDRRSDADNFHIVNVETTEDITSFCEIAKTTSLNQKEFIKAEQETNNLAYYSCLPTLRLTALTNEFDFLSPTHKDDNIPRIAWGKYMKNNGKLELTISMEVNHRFVDGIHIERFAQKLEDLINNLQ